ncbi:tetratricopeptide repeat protein [bacterium]|nr:tetratricopeptide repeat protein [bacterium]MBU1599675.1 tetratricopeptide repeat protein [bacterium]
MAVSGQLIKITITERKIKYHPDVATSLNNLAALYRAQGKYAEAFIRSNYNFTRAVLSLQ